jgi:hypothetical protein
MLACGLTERRNEPCGSSSAMSDLVRATLEVRQGEIQVYGIPAIPMLC